VACRYGGGWHPAPGADAVAAVADQGAEVPALAAPPRHVLGVGLGAPALADVVAAAPALASASASVGAFFELLSASGDRAFCGAVSIWSSTMGRFNSINI
jgi:hypothetical protein